MEDIENSIILFLAKFSVAPAEYEQLRIVGNHGNLGNWDPKRGIILRAEKDRAPYYVAETTIPEKFNLEYKIVRFNIKDGSAKWENLEGNR